MKAWKTFKRIVPLCSNKINNYFEQGDNMRLPNGYGSISKLSGNRRNPWRVRKTDGWELVDGKLKQKYVNIGYFKTRSEALEFLSDYNRNPMCLKPDITFEEVYDRWSDKKFKDTSLSSINGYSASYKICEPLYKIRFADIKLSHLQHIIDNCGKNYSTLKKTKTLFSQLFDYAVANEIISKERHIVEYLDIGTQTKSDLHYRFTDSEIAIIKQWATKNEYIQLILMLIYSGVRPGELFALKAKDVYLEEQYFYIEKGKNQNAARRVPIHNLTMPYFKFWLSKGTEYLITQHNGKPIKFDVNHKQYTESYWTPLLSEMGILNYTNAKGEQREHLPDDTRHTFTSMWKDKKLDEAMRRKIQGHSGKGIGEMVYTHYDMSKLLEEINKL